MEEKALVDEDLQRLYLVSAADYVVRNNTILCFENIGSDVSADNLMYDAAECFDLFLDE